MSKKKNFKPYFVILILISIRVLTTASILSGQSLSGSNSIVNTNPTLYTLDDCYKLALERNVLIKQARNNVYSNVIDNRTAKYSMLPSLSYDIGHYFSFGKNIDPVTNNYINETFSGGYTSLSLQLQLFTGFSRINTIRQSEYNTQSAEYAKKKLELELLTNITLTYARLLLDKEQLTIQRNNIQSTVNELNVVNEKIKVGRLSKYEYFTFNARLNTEQAELITLQNDSVATVQDLRRLMNWPYQIKLTIASIDTSKLSEIYGANISTEEITEDVLARHPAIKQAEMDAEAAKIGVKIARSNSLPSLSMGGNIVSNYNSDQEDVMGGKVPLGKQLNNNLGQNINISLRIPVFSQLENLTRVKKEKIKVLNAQLATDDAKNAISTNTLQLINDFNSARHKYASTLSAWEQNNLSYNLYNEKYRIGQISSVELLTARDILNASTSKYIQAKLQLFFQFQLLQLIKTF